MSPVNLTSPESSETTITLRWPLPESRILFSETLSFQNSLIFYGILEGFTLTYRDLLTGESWNIYLNSGKLTYKIRNLRPGNTYGFVMRSHTLEGYGNSGEEVFVQTKLAGILTVFMNNRYVL